MLLNADLDNLYYLCKDKDWFHDVSTDMWGRHIVYVHYMNSDIMSYIPTQNCGKQVLCHYAAASLAKKDNFIKSNSLTGFQFDKTVIQSSDEEVYSLADLISALDHLESKVGSNIMNHIFYEVHDKHNAVTNLSATFPLIRSKMEELYSKYGFDLIYENIDG